MLRQLMISAISLVKGARAEIEFVDAYYPGLPIARAAQDSSGLCPLGFCCKHDKNWEPVFKDTDGKIRPLRTEYEWSVFLLKPVKKGEVVGRIYFVFTDSKIKEVRSVWLK